MGQTACCTPDSDNNMVFNPNRSNVSQNQKINGEKYTAVQKAPKLTGYVD